MVDGRARDEPFIKMFKKKNVKNEIFDNSILFTA